MALLDPSRRPSVADGQCGIVMRAQLYAEGWTPAAVRANVEAGRWRYLNDDVVCTHNGPLTPEQQRWAVVLSAQPPAALCGLTVVDWSGIRVHNLTVDEVHVLVRRGARVLPVPGVRVRVHESRRFGSENVNYRDGLPVTSLPRSVMDAAVWSSDALSAARIVVAGVQQRRVSAVAVRRELVAAGMVRHRRVLLPLMNDLAGGAEALSEVEFLAFCKRHRLPAPELQHRFDSAGRRRYLDATWRLPDGRLVMVEVDGGVHLTLTARWRDTAKDNDAALAGKVVLRFPSVAIYTDDPVAVGQLRRALGTCQQHRRL